MKSHLLGVLLLAAPLATTAANDTQIALSEYQKQVWQVEDGLPQSNVRSIIQLPDRLLLIATSDGMVRFDGLRFTPVKVDASDDLAREPVNSLLISRNGDLWIGTDDRGVIRKRGNESLAISEEAGLHQERIRSFYEDRAGNIWVATQNGIERIVGDKIESYDAMGLVPGDITSPFAEDVHGDLFIVTAKGLFLWSNSHAVKFELQHRELGVVDAVRKDKTGAVWSGFSGGVLQLIPQSGNRHWEQVVPGIRGPFTSMVQDREENIWMGTKGRGMCRVSPSLVAQCTTSEGLPDETVRSLAVDDEDNLWIGTLSGGLGRWRKSTLVPFGQPEGFPNSFVANALGDSHGDLWLGTWGSGLLRMTQGKLQKEHLPGSTEANPIRSLVEDKRGNIWIGTWFNGLYRFDGKAIQHFVIGGESVVNAISDLLADRRGGLWVGTYNGLIRFASGTPVKGQGETFLPGKLITSMKETADGSIVVGTFQGLYLLKDSTVVPITAKNGLSNGFILSVSTDSRGGVWVGTKAGGVDFLQGDRVTHLPAESGIPAYPVSSLLDDGRGMLWLSTTRGLLRVPLSQMHEVVDGKRKVVDAVLLGKNDGMRSSECGGASQPPATKAKDGTLWFSTAKGFVHTFPSEEVFKNPPPVVSITGFLLDNTPLAVANSLTLAPGTTDFEILFDAVRLANPSQIQFRYKLEGYDRDWTTVRSRHATYKHLPPGKYRFLVTAHDSSEPWTEQLAAVELFQKPFFYQTGWFYALVGVAVVGIVLLFLRWRVAGVKRRLRLIMEERNRIGREWHDTIMAGLAAISWQLEATEDRFEGKTNGATSSLQLARGMVRHCQAEARRIIWDLHDEAEPVGPLSEAVSKALAGMAAKLDVSPQLKVTGEEVSLEPVAVHHLVCICQEAVTNAIRHASPKNIEIGLEYRTAGMTLTVKDDGSGFRMAQASVPGHFGLSVMEERARKLGGKLRVESSPGLGTEIFVEVPSAAIPG